MQISKAKDGTYPTSVLLGGSVWVMGSVGFRLAVSTAGPHLRA